MVDYLRYNLQMFGVPIYGSSGAFYDKEVVYKNTITPESFIEKKHHYIAYHRFREAVSDKNIRVAMQVTENNIADLFTKIMTAAS